MTRKVRDVFLTGLGILLVIIGVIGIFLPVLPATVFLLMAAWCFTNASPKLNHWLLTHPHLGPPVTEWRAHGVIPFRGKVLAIVMMSTSLAYLIFFSSAPVFVAPLVGAILFCVAIFIVTRPSRPPESLTPQSEQPDSLD
ncbi:MAG: uncharacterized membrane protein YbaN (DUF454 family) [Parvibaculaceae bacterium]|jgi:uncharacterized membrane protein YbaN (DUF454 family)